MFLILTLFYLIDTDKDDSVFEPAEEPMDIPSKSPDIVDSDQKESSEASSAPENTDVEKPVLPAEKPDRVTRTKSRQLTTTSNSSTTDNKTTQSAAVTNASTVSTSIVSTGSVVSHCIISTSLYLTLNILNR